MAEVEKTRFELPADITGLLLQRVEEVAEGTLVLLPARLGPPGGQYRDAHLLVPKELRAEGVPVEFLHSRSAERTGLSEFSAEVVVAFSFGVAQNMTWDAAKAVWQYLHLRARALVAKGQEPSIRLDVVRVERDGLVIEGLTITGPANDKTAAEVIRALTGEKG